MEMTGVGERSNQKKSKYARPFGFMMFAFDA